MNATNWKPRAVVKRLANIQLHQILTGTAGYSTYGYSNQATNALYYEVLEMSLNDLEQRKNVRIIMLTDGIQKEVSRLNDTGDDLDMLTSMHRNLSMSLLPRAAVLAMPLLPSNSAPAFPTKSWNKFASTKPTLAESSRTWMPRTLYLRLTNS